MLGKKTTHWVNNTLYKNNTLGEQHIVYKTKYLIKLLFRNTQNTLKTEHIG